MERTQQFKRPLRKPIEACGTILRKVKLKVRKVKLKYEEGTACISRIAKPL